MSKNQKPPSLIGMIVVAAIVIGVLLIIGSVELTLEMYGYE